MKLRKPIGNINLLLLIDVSRRLTASPGLATGWANLAHLENWPTRLYEYTVSLSAFSIEVFSNLRMARVGLDYQGIGVRCYGMVPGRS